MAYEEGRKFAISYRSQKIAGQETPMHGEQLLVIFESPDSNFAFLYTFCVNLGKSSRISFCKYDQRSIDSWILTFVCFSAPYVDRHPKILQS